MKNHLKDSGDIGGQKSVTDGHTLYGRKDGQMDRWSHSYHPLSALRLGINWKYLFFPWIQISIFEILISPFKLQISLFIWLLLISTFNWRYLFFLNMDIRVSKNTNISNLNKDICFWNANIFNQNTDISNSKSNIFIQ